MKVLKTCVQNINRPEGCMVENYIVEEAREFCAEFMAGVSFIGLNSSVTKTNKTWIESIINFFFYQTE